MAIRENLENQIFGKVLVLECVGKKSGHLQYKCICECGKVFVTKGIRLKSGHTKSCGCFRKTHTVKKNQLEYGLASKKYWYNVYKRNAAKRNLSFDLALEQFVNLTSQNCYFCGAVPKNEVMQSAGANGGYICNGIDRKNNALGYVIENCFPCCFDCNNAKKTMSHDDFLNLIVRICKFKEINVINPGNFQDSIYELYI